MIIYIAILLIAQPYVQPALMFVQQRSLDEGSFPLALY